MIGILISWSLGLYAYLSLKGLIPLHFGLSGRPDRFGSGIEFLIITPLLTIAPVIILGTTRYRFTLVNKYPYLINLPAFFAYIFGTPFERRGYWVNKYIEAVLAVGVCVSLLTNLILWGGLRWSVRGGASKLVSPSYLIDDSSYHCILVLLLL